ncbi:MAG: hypothetical protein ACYDIC_17400 [Desulfobaccales bacterium]
MLIDCGALFGTPDASQKLKVVARDIIAATSGNIDVVVLTSGHWDHISGFFYAEKIFKKHLKIGQVWLPWKEDPENPKAVQLRVQLPQYISFLRTALRMVLEQHSALGSEAVRLLREAEAAQKEPHPMLGQSLSVSPKGAAAFATARQCAQEIRYLSAGDLLEKTGLRFYILNPPRPAAMAGAGYLSMVSHVLRGMGIGDERAMDYALQLLALFSTWDQFSPEERGLIQRSRPFDRAEMVPLSEAPQSKDYGAFFRTHFGFADPPDHGPAWRRIEADWVEPAHYLMEQLWMTLEFSNQAMAIELVENGKVLLFPGDARDKTWKWWHKLTWQVKESDTRVTFPDLLQRIMLYKVSHHGSRLGTPLDELALMTNPHLVAMLPVDQEQAASKHWIMPEAMLYQELLKQTQGRVLRLDREMPEKPAEVAAEEWSQFAQRVEFDPKGLWIEYTIDP